MAYIEPAFSWSKPFNSPANVDAIKIFDIKGPWPTKSNARLSVLFAMGYAEIEDYLTYDKNELAHIPTDIRGLRSYTVTGLEKGSRGGMEFHRIRKEILFAVAGEVKIEAEDVFGNQKCIHLNASTGICLPPFTLHTYEAMQDNSSNLVICNTLFNPQEPETHDTYSEKTFRRLQALYR